MPRNVGNKEVLWVPVRAWAVKSRPDLRVTVIMLGADVEHPLVKYMAIVESFCDI